MDVASTHCHTSSRSSASLLILQTEETGLAAPCFSDCHSSSLLPASHHSEINQLFYRKKGGEEAFSKFVVEM